MNDTIGIHYELPDGSIVRTYGFGPDGIKYYFDDGKGGRLATDEEFQTWKPRKDITDFPNASDPRLPYEFDLHWDIKYTSDLKEEVRGHRYEDEIRECAKRHGVEI